MVFSWHVFLVCSCFLFTPLHGRLHRVVHPKHLHAYSRISLPPAPAPAPAPDAVSPSYDAPQPESKALFDVRAFGAIGDGMADDTIAFKSAWDAACQVDYAKLLVPNGYSFVLQPAIFTGPCKQNLVLQIDGTVLAPDGPDLWPKNSSRKQWIIFYKINGMTVQGRGVVDGKGEKWWNLPCKPHRGINGTILPGPCDSPVAIRFFSNFNLTVQGIEVTNSPQFHLRFDYCQDVHINSLNIKSPAQSPNTDGIHVENTREARIYNSIISSGDDCLSIGAGSHDIDIENVTCGPSHGISIGSLGIHNSRACVSNITVKNSLIKHSDNGVRIKTWQGGSGSVSDVTFTGVYMDTVRNPIIIDQYYCLTKKCDNQTSAVSISSVSYLNIKGTFDVRSPPMRFACSDTVPCTNITVAGVELLPATLDTKHVSQPFCWNAYGTLQTLSVPPIYCLLEGTPIYLLSAESAQC
ncbi:hypothetical protein Nepgr_001639 [Nepenthes gracilis]|uniref:Polygalacturonase n=1 Tax=Nepenthes gracilis TaxID=150966 RepID=A0AAD3P6D5_NEPGR|nr:hypothetical protein Nepgr_001639 [Nepenthes gracilis]